MRALSFNKSGNFFNVTTRGKNWELAYIYSMIKLYSPNSYLISLKCTW